MGVAGKSRESSISTEELVRIAALEASQRVASPPHSDDDVIEKA